MLLWSVLFSGGIISHYSLQKSLRDSGKVEGYKLMPAGKSRMVIMVC
jgi:hypothetical protein